MDLEQSRHHESFLNRHRWISYGALAALAYYLLTEHRQHVIEYLPYIFLAACPLMHLFHHHGHRHHHNNNEHRQEENRS